MKVSTNKKLKKFREATDKIIERAKEIQLAAENSKEALIKLFSRHEARVTCDIVIEFAVASIAIDSDSLKGEREHLQQLRDQTMLTNELISSHIKNNPHLLSTFTTLENLVIKVLIDHPKLPSIFYPAGIALIHLFRSPLFTGFEQIHLALTNGEASDTLNSRKSVITFMRSLYDKQSPQLNSYPRIVNSVRFCTDIHDPHYNEFAKIQMLVREWASAASDGEDKVWRSLAQELKPSHRK